jgi:hypothetical protein
LALTIFGWADFDADLLALGDNLAPFAFEDAAFGVLFAGSATFTAAFGALEDLALGDVADAATAPDFARFDAGASVVLRARPRPGETTSSDICVSLLPTLERQRFLLAESSLMTGLVVI